MSGLQEWIQPALVVGLLLFIWRDLSRRIDHISDRIDRHLEGHP